MSLLFTILAFAVALGVLIVVHEFGHYLVARWCGVKVLRFSVGFGRPLYTRVAGLDRTEWVIAAFPLGGYVKMLDEAEGNVAAHDLPRAFNRQPLGRRAAIVVAGPVANFLLAIVLYWALFLHGVPGVKPLVAAPPQQTAAAAGGFRAGDRILEVGGQPVATWQDARWELLRHAVGRSRLEVLVSDEHGVRALRTLDLTALSARDIDENLLERIGLRRFQPPIEPVIGTVVAGSAAARAGLRPGDRITAVDGRGVDTWEQLVNAIRARPGEATRIELRRDGRDQPALTITPDAATDNGERIGRIGVSPRIDRAAFAQLHVDVRYGPLESAWRALARTWDTSVFSLQMLWKMITGAVSLTNLSGPLTIADYAGQTAQVGLVAYLSFLALISISLGVINLLPIPMLDGGHLMYYAIELVQRRPVSERAMEVGQQIGMGMLFLLMAFAIFNDLSRLIGG
jgi:regulator of sigma E protease